MSNSNGGLGSLIRGLSARLLVLTIVFVMLSEVMIYVPSIARFRESFLTERIAAAHLASLTLKATSDYMVSKELTEELLAQSGLQSVIIKQPERRTLMLSLEMPTKVDASFDLREAGPIMLIIDAFDTLLAEDGRVIRVIDESALHRPDSFTEIILNEHQMRDAMITYSINILALSIVISIFTASLVFLSLHILMVRPMQRLTASMIRFRKAPADGRSLVTTTNRRDEIGAATAELNQMQGELRTALQQQAHLAALGAAVSKISHDLRNMLATAQLVSDGLSNSDDPTVKKLTPPLIASIDRAIELCARTLSFGRAEEQAPDRTVFPLAALVDDVCNFLGVSTGPGNEVRVLNEVAPTAEINADRDQLFRVLMNLTRNAVEALGGTGNVWISSQSMGHGVAIHIRDDGPGLAEKARAHLFQPFTGSAKAGGTGLGLAIARELVMGHGGDIYLVSSTPLGTEFRLEIPAPDAFAGRS
jgi:signal transduction histidine kinase